jgi:hypothetical protein
VNQLNVVPDKDKGNNLTLCMPVIPISLIWAKNYPTCSYVVVASSSVNLVKSGTINP